MARAAWQDAPAHSDAASSQDPETRLKQAYTRLAARDIQGAEAIFRELIRANAKEIGAYVGLAQALAARGDLAGSIGAYRQAIALNPRSAAFRAGLADVLQRSGDRVGAMRELQEAVSLEPGNARYRLDLSAAYRQIGWLVDAQREAVQALGRAPEDPSVYLELGAIHEAMERWDSALECYTAAERLDPSSVEVKVAVVNALLAAHRYAEAESRCKVLVERYPDNVDARLAWAATLDGLGRHAEAQQECRHLLTLQPNNAVVWGNLGWFQFLAGELQEALTSTEKAIQLDSGLAYVRYNLGLLLAVKGDRQRAEEAYAAALRTGDRSDLRGAIRDLRNQLVRKPNDAILMAMLAMLEEALQSQVVKRLAP